MEMRVSFNGSFMHKRGKLDPFLSETLQFLVNDHPINNVNYNDCSVGVECTYTGLGPDG